MINLSDQIRFDWPNAFRKWPIANYNIIILIAIISKFLAAHFVSNLYKLITAELANDLWQG